MLSILLLAALTNQAAHAGGVTVITHGYNGNVDGWITGMADQIPGYPSFPGTNYTIYKVVLTHSGSSFFVTSTRTNGVAPAASDSGEIIVKLDWSSLSTGAFTTQQIAPPAAWALQQTNLIAEMNGHALAELPIHLIGHSRGGSLVAEMSRVLGSNGVWVDHLTSLDPHPFNNDGFNDTFLFPTDVTASNTYFNVLFADNYWQNSGNGFTVPNGEPVVGAYTRHLTTLSSSDPYGSTHSDVHLWYHGTINWTTPVSDTEQTITTNERTAWWVAFEQKGVNAGFEYSLIGGSDRFSTNRPLGGATSAIVDGFNKWWDLGAGSSPINRVAIATNNGAWPSIMRLNRTTTNSVLQGQSISVKYYYQWAQPGSSNATISFYLDDDANPFNTNQTFLQKVAVPGTTAASFESNTVALTLAASNAAPGLHSVFAVISGGGPSRYLYAPEKVLVLSNPPPVLDIAQIDAARFRIGVTGLIGQTVILQSSPDLTSWQALVTNTLTTNRWLYTNTPPADAGKLFYRALLGN